MEDTGRRLRARVRREHKALGDELARLTHLARGTARSAPARQALARALDAFLHDWGTRLPDHVTTEAGLVDPQVADSLPPGTGTLDAFQQERESVEAILDLLRQSLGWLRQLEPGAEAEVAAALTDLQSLWASHIRRADLLAPLLTSLKDHGHA